MVENEFGMGGKTEVNERVRRQCTGTRSIIKKNTILAKLRKMDFVLSGNASASPVRPKRSRIQLDLHLSPSKYPTDVDIHPSRSLDLWIGSGLTET